jgi:hypothetical protein
MPFQNTPSPALHAVQEHWRALAKDDDPIVRAAARELLADLAEISQPRSRADTATATYWYLVIDQVIDAEPHRSVTSGSFKTGHGHAHASKSGTCVSVDTRRGLWYCSSCRRGGTAITWVMDIEQCSYGEAWEILVRRFGAEHANPDPD